MPHSADTDPPDLEALAHHDPPRRPIEDRDHDFLQRQIDALRAMYDAMLVHSRTVGQQIADLTIRAQRTDADVAASNRNMRLLTTRLEEHMVSSDKRDADLDHRINEITRGQAEILKVVQGGSDLLQQMRDRSTASRVLTAWLKSTSGVVIALGVIAGGLFAVAKMLVQHAPPG